MTNIRRTFINVLVGICIGAILLYAFFSIRQRFLPQDADIQVSSDGKIVSLMFESRDMSDGGDDSIDSTFRYILQLQKNGDGRVVESQKKLWKCMPGRGRQWYDTTNCN